MDGLEMEEEEEEGKRWKIWVAKVEMKKVGKEKKWVIYFFYYRCFKRKKKRNDYELEEGLGEILQII